MSDVEERFWTKVVKSPGCWLWIGYTLPDGYGQLSISGRKVRAHRFAYELSYGQIPQGLVLDHLCRARACVRPDHLEPVTNRENVSRGKALIDRCPSGHEYDADNTRVRPEGWRVCRACHRDYSQVRATAKFTCEHCGKVRNQTHRARHLRTKHPELAA